MPVGGLLEGQDPANVTYPETYAPVLENIRVSQAVWATRLGQVLLYQVPGSGDVRLLDALYQSNGAFTWLAAMGTGAAAQLYELKGGTDTGFVTASGGSSLGGTAQPYFQGVTVGDFFYLTDRANSLYRYSPAQSPNHLKSLTLPTAPATAATVVPRPWMILEDWHGTAWTTSSAPDFNDSGDDTANPPPMGTTSNHLFTVSGTGGTNQTITDTTPPATALFSGDQPLQSHSVAFWTKRDANARKNVALAFQLGLNAPADYSETLAGDSQLDNTWYPWFLPIGDLAAANYARFLCTNSTGGGSYWVSSIYLPGTLEGPYRWVYTYFDSTTGRESAPSPITNAGQPVDFSMVGQSFALATAGAFAKAAALAPAISGDGTVNLIRIYRNGGVPSLTVDGNGQPLWLWVADIPNFSTTVAVTATAPANQVQLTSVTGLTVGSWLVLDPGVTGAEEYVQVTSIVGSVAHLNRGLGHTGAGGQGQTLYTHTLGAAVRIAYVDNTPNETINLTQTVDVPIVTGESARTSPPAGARFVQRSPEGRLWLCGFPTNPNGVAISNLATPFRPADYETFTVGVDPLTRGSETMGWNFQLFRNLAQDEVIEWGGFFHGWFTILTKGNLYVVTAHSQAEWGPTSVQRIHSVGCLDGGGDTVREVDGVLYWVAPGPKVMRWDGVSAPENISHHRCNVRLAAAPPGQWGKWYAQTQNRQDGRYYMLYFVPAGQTQPTQRLDYNIDLDAWEPCVYYALGLAPIGFRGTLVAAVSGGSTVPYQIDTSGNVWQAETGTMDGAQPVRITFQTPKIPLVRSHPYWQRQIADSWLHSVYLRMAAAADTVTLTATTGQGELAPITRSYPINLLGNVTGIQNALPQSVPGQDTEIPQRLDRELFGRYVQFQVQGLVANSPQFRTLSFFFIPVRVKRAWG